MISSSGREHFWSQDQLWKTYINQLTLFWFQLMYYRKWPQFGKKWGSRNHHLKTNGFPCIALVTVWIFFPGGSSNVPQQIGWIFFYQEWLLVKNHSILLETFRATTREENPYRHKSYAKNVPLLFDKKSFTYKNFQNEDFHFGSECRKY